MQKEWSVPLLAALVASAVANSPSAASAQQPVLTETEQDIHDAYQVMQGVTMGLLGATALGGTIQLYNLPTAFGDGACAPGGAEPIFGEYACEGHYSLLHGGLGILSIASYTATAALALAAPDLDQGGEDTVTDVLGYVHGIGLGLTGLIGIIAANPGLLGIDEQGATEFQRVMRTIHIAVALVTTSAFATHMAVDYLD